MPQKLHEWDISTNTHIKIGWSLHPTGRMPRTILRLWGFSCVRDARRRSNKINENKFHSIPVPTFANTGIGPYTAEVAFAFNLNSRIVLLEVDHGYCLEYPCKTLWVEYCMVAEHSHKTAGQICAAISKKKRKKIIFLQK